MTYTEFSNTLNRKRDKSFINLSNTKCMPTASVFRIEIICNSTSRRPFISASRLGNQLFATIKKR